MQGISFTVARAACAYFFVCPGIVYGMLTARLPALSVQINANEAEIGLVLLSLGLAGLTGLSGSAWLIKRWGSRAILCTGSWILLASLPLCGLATNPLTLGAACMMLGFGIGLTDVAMNTQAIYIERRYRIPCMALMHASYSLGGVVGSVSGAIFASMSASPWLNFITVLGIYICLRPLASPRLQEDIQEEENQRTRAKRSMPLFVIGCGLLALLDYSAEGSVAEWGSLLLFTVKGASEQTAALVFGTFSLATVCCRLFCDRLRRILGDFPLAFGGTFLASCGMALVLFADSPTICLLGYACMGIGLSPIVPLLFSRAGSYPGVSAGEASAIISVLAYGGLLFFPPTLGWLAHRVGLGNALFVVLGLCCLLTVGTVLLRHKPKQVG